MPRRTPVLDRRCFLAASLAGLSGACSQTPRAQPPNIVLLLADDMGYGDLASYGCPDTATPHTDSIGAQGIRFSNFYANAPQCTPTRTALLTGRYQQRVGGLECAIGVGDVGRYDEAIWLAERGELGLPSTELTLGRIFQSRGYDTACFGKWHLGYRPQFSPNRHGFDEFFGIMGGNADYFRHTEASGLNVLYHNSEPVHREGYLTDLLVDSAVQWLRQRQKNPFLLYLPFTAPHTPLQGPGDAAKLVTPGNWNKGDRATYVKLVESMDAGIGRVLAQLDAMGAADNTLVVFLSDNGGYNLSRNDPFRGQKSVLLEGGIRVPCMMRWPGVIPAGAESSQVGLTMDLFPTFLAAAGIDPPANRTLDGIDLMPVVRGEREPAARTVFFRYKRGDVRQKAVLHGSMKYLWRNGREDLFNIATDVHEDENIAADFPSLVTELKDKLAEWETEVRAPRLAAFHGA